MADERADLPDLQGLGPRAQRAVAAARSQAAGLGHARIGTEHLLLGILTDEQSDATQVPTALGASHASVRSKVREARGPVPGVEEPATDEGTPRAARAITRSARFARRRHNGSVAPEDLLIGVLDVEGTAGQVLRSLGVDLDDVVTRLDGDVSDADAVGADVVPPARCPVCDVELTQLTHQRATSTGSAGPVDLLLHSCPACESLLGMTPG